VPDFGLYAYDGWRPTWPAAFIEWPDAGAGLLPDPRVTVDIDHLQGDARLITLSCDDSGLLNALAAALARYRD